ncbi:MAG: NAD(P)H-dependent oxidoreductase subunit E [Melioribacteraceae bacterium]
MHKHFINEEANRETRDLFSKNKIRVCRGIVCHVKNSANILQALETELGIKSGNTTGDKYFTLETVACSGACSLAPVINVNEDYYGRINVKDIPNILNRYMTDANDTNDETFSIEQKINTN